MDRVKGKVALITGAASGIGKATAILLAREGATVAVTDLAANGALKTAAEIAAQFPMVSAHALDVTSEPNWEAVISEVVEKWGGLDILVNNAGIFFAKPVTEMTLAEWRNVMAVNLDGVFLGTKYGIRAMQKNGGSIIRDCEHDFISRVR